MPPPDGRTAARLRGLRRFVVTGSAVINAEGLATPQPARAKAGGKSGLHGDKAPGSARPE